MKTGKSLGNPLNPSSIASMPEEITPEENDRRFRACLQQIRKLTHEDLVGLMGKQWLEDYRRQFQ